jgi:hypothetical protein
MEFSFSLNAHLAYSINKYKNTKRKLLICNANIYFNKCTRLYCILTTSDSSGSVRDNDIPEDGNQKGVETCMD